MRNRIALLLAAIIAFGMSFSQIKNQYFTKGYHREQYVPLFIICSFGLGLFCVYQLWKSWKK